MDKILVLYYSGVGNTKRIATMIQNKLLEKYDVDTYSIEKLHSNFSFEKYKAVVLGFPTIHSSLAKPMEDFLKKLEKVKNPIRTYIFTTFGLYSSNSLRITALKCREKNLIPILNRGYRCKAVDGILLTPYIKCWFSDEKKLEDKIDLDTKKFISLMEESLKIDIPRIKLYSILNYPNKLLGSKYTFKIYLHKDECIKCNKCSINCPASAIEVGKEGLPQILMDKCINCYRCIYHCPKKALSLSKRSVLNETLYEIKD